MLEKILILLVVALAAGGFRRGRPLVLLAASTMTIFWLQPATEPLNLQFWIPLGTLVIVVLAWYVTASPDVRAWKQNWPAVVTVTCVVLLVDFNRILGLARYITIIAPRPLWLLLVAAALAGILAVVSVSRRWDRAWPALFITVLLSLFVLIKLPGLAYTLFDRMMQLNEGQNEPATLVFQWLGFSYIAFRLIHTLREHQTGRLPAVRLDEFVTYVIFFPALTAGPIDRIERFVPELRQPVPVDSEAWVFIIRRVSFGLFKKFVLADMLSAGALNDALAWQVNSTFWMWVVVYAFALQILLDFSGYTDIAIGMARLVGIRLPENFAAPYFQTNITQFWNNWHITLTQWFRVYYFNPLVRVLRATRLPLWSMMALAQFSTMVLIGMWHGVTRNFMLWGLWHACGLFIHNRWGEWLRIRMQSPVHRAVPQKLLSVGGALLTFHFVALGWVFFALSTPDLSFQVLLKLLGLHS